MEFKINDEYIDVTRLYHGSDIIHLIQIANNQIEQLQKDNSRLKILFDSEFCRCSKCGEYKRSGFGCYCENEK